MDRTGKERFYKPAFWKGSVLESTIPYPGSGFWKTHRTQHMVVLGTNLLQYKDTQYNQQGKVNGAKPKEPGASLQYTSPWYASLR